MSFNPAPAPAPDAANPYLANPYAAPYAQPDQAPATLDAPDGVRLDVPLYTSGHVSLATFLGAPLGGAALMALNERRAGRNGAALKMLFGGVVGTALLLSLGFILPEGIPTFPIGIGSLVAMGAIARHTQGTVVNRHLAMGGRRASGWAAAGIGVLSAIVIFVPLVAILAAAELMTGP